MKAPDAAFRLRRCLLLPAAACCCLLPLRSSPVQASSGMYLYASPESLEECRGNLKITFVSTGPRTVVAYGRRNRKIRRSRDGTTEAERERFKPVRATMKEGGRVALFPHLPPDYYDILVVDTGAMTVAEGMQLLPAADKRLATDQRFAAIRDSLGLRSDRIGGWEGFFDTKQFARFETDGLRAGVLLQQMRLGKTHEGGGAILKGTIHSLDVVWLEQARVQDAGWQVITRQQLYRKELPTENFFKTQYVPKLHGIRVGVRGREIGPVDLGN